MLLFCPYCSNLLVVQKGNNSCNQFSCCTCPYVFDIIEHLFFSRKMLEQKKSDDFLGGEGAWDAVDQTDAQCPIDSCGATRAYFMQLQIRSADEPMTLFYKCVDCGKQWREN